MCWQDAILAPCFPRHSMPTCIYTCNRDSISHPLRHPNSELMLPTLATFHVTIIQSRTLLLPSPHHPLLRPYLCSLFSLTPIPPRPLSCPFPSPEFHPYLIPLPLYARVFDYDQFSYDDTIGIVTLDLSCLLSPEGPKLISGWLPIFDTFSGTWPCVRVHVGMGLHACMWTYMRTCACPCTCRCTSASTCTCVCAYALTTSASLPACRADCSPPSFSIPRRSNLAANTDTTASYQRHDHRGRDHWHTPAVLYRICTPASCHLATSSCVIPYRVDSCSHLMCLCPLISSHTHACTQHAWMDVRAYLTLRYPRRAEGDGAARVLREHQPPQGAVRRHPVPRRYGQ